MTYNKLVIFDLDGVLLDSRLIHWGALNAGLRNVAGEQYVISMDEHTSLYDGLPTTKKLKMLTEKKGLPVHLYDDVWKEKQRATIVLYETRVEKDYALIQHCKKLADNNIKIAVASNSIRKTMQIALIRLGIIEYVDYFISNEDVKKSKPYPEMYWKCMEALNAIPSTTVIFEDSHIGRQGAIDSGAHMIPVENVNDLTADKIIEAIKIVNDVKDRPNVPWKDSKLNVLIPMAGAGSRFASAGYTFPKPLIEVHGKPMIQVVVENLNIQANYIFIVQKAHYEQYNLKYLLNLIAPNCKIVQVDGLTEGAACTTLLAKEFIDNDNPLLIVNSDQFVEWNSNEVMYSFGADNIDAGIVTFKASHPKWSFASVRKDGFVDEVAEKKVISDNATVGIYFWKHGKDYVSCAEQMIEKNIRTNNEFYVAPVLNELIKRAGKVRLKQITRMWGIGTPEDLDTFLRDYKGKV